MTAFNWDSTIEKDGGDFKLLPEGIYPFTIKKLEKGFFNGSSNVPPCPRAQLTLRVGTGMDVSDVTEGLLLDDSLEWKLCQFFTGIGARKHGEPLAMNWDDDFIVGKTGWVQIGHRSYTNKDGEEKVGNQVEKFLDPVDFPPDGKPVVQGGADGADDEW